MRIRMLKTDRGCEDRDPRLRTYEEGQEYDVSDALAAAFFSTQSAEPVEAKSLGGAPENKARRK